MAWEIKNKINFQLLNSIYRTQNFLYIKRNVTHISGDNVMKKLIILLFNFTLHFSHNSQNYFSQYPVTK